MKKYLKLNYGYYVVAFVVFLMYMIKCVFEYNDFYLRNIFNMDQLPLEVKLIESVGNVTGVNSLFLDAYPKILIFGFVILHGIMLWGQRNKSEREFLETLPVRRERIMLYRFAMDVIVLISVVIITCIVTYVYLYENLIAYDITFPWMIGSIVGYGITLCCYMTLLLGVMYFLESLVVRGDLKVITTAGCMAMFQLSTSWLYNAVMLGQDNIFNKFIGFIKMYAVGGKEYRIDSEVWEPQGYWLEKDIPFDIYYQGKKYEFATGINTVDGNRTRWGYTDGVVALSEIELYIGYAFAYLVIGAILFALAIHLTKKQDLAKRSFYFDFAPLMVGLLIFLTVFMFFFVQIPEYWYSCILLGLLAFLGFMYVANGKRRIKL